jgi:hypothetical protein
VRPRWAPIYLGIIGQTVVPMTPISLFESAQTGNYDNEVMRLLSRASNRWPGRRILHNDKVTTNMNMRDRMLAVVRGEPHDLVPFVQYEMGTLIDEQEVWSTIGHYNMGLLRWVSAHRSHAPNCSFDREDIERDGRRGIRTTLRTPVGQLVEETFFEPALGSGSIRRHFVKQPEDYRILTSFFRDRVIQQDLSQVEKCERELGTCGLPHVAVERTPYQQLWTQWVSLEDFSLHLVDCPETIAECVAAMTDNQQGIFEAIRNAPIPYVVFPDNITAPTIGEANFRRYCMPAYERLYDMLSDRDIPIYVHMDGDLAPLWTAIGESKVRGLDSLSPPPDNDTSIEQAVRMWPEMRLSPNFPSSVHLADPQTVYSTAARILEEGGHSGRLQIQISENPPPGAWRKSYPEIVRAIRDFGKP